MRITRTKIAAVVAGTAVIALGATAAVAYWTVSGTSTQTATAANLQNIGIVTVNAPSNLYPVASLGDGGSVDGYFTNPNAFPVVITSFKVKIASITKAVGAVGACGVGDFAIQGGGLELLAAPYSIAANPATTPWGPLDLALIDDGTNQKGCIGATVNLTLTAS